MTLKEMVRKNSPACVDGEYDGGVLGCPADYSYLRNISSCGNCDAKCEECWNRKYVPIEDDLNPKESAKTLEPWTYCEDGMPEHDQWVFVYTRDGFMTSMQYDASDPPGFVDDHDEYFGVADVVAWMPWVPAPLKRVD